MDQQDPSLPAVTSCDGATVLRIICERGKRYTGIAALTSMFAFAALADEPSGASVSGQGAQWTGAYVGGHLGYAWGSSDWTASSGISGEFGLAQPINTFDEGEASLRDCRLVTDHMLLNRFVIGIEADARFRSFQEHG